MSRIIAGRYKRRDIPIPDVPGCRPTLGHLRETMFSWLGPKIPGAHCLDAFAGSGLLGLEGLSRGAKHVCFVDTHPAVIAHLQAQFKRLGCDHASAHRATLPHWSPPCAFDVVWLDPPYDLDIWPTLFTWLGPHLAPQAWVVIEAPVAHTLTPPQTWARLKEKCTTTQRISVWKT